MATQSGIGITKILIIAGAGYIGTVLIKNGKLSELIGELQLLVKGSLKKSGDQGEGEGEYAEANAAPLTSLGWKGVSLSDLMYVTKRNVQKVVADFTKKLHHASDVIADARNHLAQRFQYSGEVSGVQSTITTTFQFHDDGFILLHQTIIEDMIARRLICIGE